MISLARERPVAAGLIYTEKAKAKEHLLSSEDDARRGLIIHRVIRGLFDRYRIVVAVQEANGGSQSSVSAKGLARAQQACIDAIDMRLGGMPILVTPQAVKYAACGSMDASKEAIKAAMIKRWKGADFPKLLEGYLESQWENVFDAAAVAHLCWDAPAVAAVRAMLV